MTQEKMLVLTSGNAEDGELSRVLRGRFGFDNEYAQVVGFVCNTARSPLAAFARARNTKYVHVSNKRLSRRFYDSIPAQFRARNPWIVLSNWEPYVSTKRYGKWGHVLDKLDCNSPGLNPERTIVIRAGLGSQHGERFGRKGLRGKPLYAVIKKLLDSGALDEKVEAHNVSGVESEKKAAPTENEKKNDEKKVDDEQKRTVAHSGFTIVFASPRYQKRLVIAEVPVELKKGMSAKQIRAVIHKAMHRWAPMIIEMVIRGQIRLVEGRVIYPLGYGLLPK